MKEKIIDIEISKLKDALDIRSTLNQEHVLYLWGLIDAGTELPPIKITKDNVIIDGRHRREAYIDAGIQIIKAEIIETDGTLSIVKRALQENIGGPLPPTKLDLYRSMLILVEKKYSKQRIVDEFSLILPVRLVRSCYEHALWKSKNRKVNEALDLIRKSNLTPEKAAQLLDIPLQSIKDKLADRKTNMAGDANMRGTLQTMFSHFNKTLSRKISEIFQRYDDGELTKLDSEGTLKFLAKLIANQNRMYADWNKRWNYKK